MRTLLKLQHHRHTAKRLPHHHTSYRGLLLIVAIFGLSIVSIQQASANIIDVSARIDAPLPTQPAVITSPTSNGAVDTSSIVVSGTCQILTPTYAVTIWRDNQFLGSSVCSSQGTFSATVQLVLGTNTIYAGTQTISNQQGPNSQPIIINYSLKQTTNSNTQVVANNPTQVQLQQPTTTPLLQISFDNTYVTYTPKLPFKLNYEIIGGSAPYILTVDWGDGSRNEYTLDSAGKNSLEHTYKTSDFYTITLSFEDKNGFATNSSIAALTFAVTGTSTTIPSVSTTSIDEFINNMYLYVWSIYAAIVAIFGGLWLRHGLLYTGTTVRAKSRTNHIKKIRQ